MNAHAGIGIFDSGVGGLTVLDAIRRTLPNEDLIYLGDTARVPYGNRTPQTIIRYALSCANILVRYHIKALVIACNTASAHALAPLSAALQTPVFGVIDPVAAYAAQTTQTKHIGVIGTRATIGSGAYERAIHALDPTITLHAAACPLFVPLVEEGWANTGIARDTALAYLKHFAPPGDKAPALDTLILGCTHYPILRDVIQETLTQLHIKARLCDCASATATMLSKNLKQRALLNPGDKAGSVRFLVTDDPEQFAAIGKAFLNEVPTDVTHIDL